MAQSEHINKGNIEEDEEDNNKKQNELDPIKSFWGK